MQGWSVKELEDCSPARWTARSKSQPVSVTFDNVKTSTSIFARVATTRQNCTDNLFYEIDPDRIRIGVPSALFIPPVILGAQLIGQSHQSHRYFCV